jgi:hypothetical protein
LSGVAVKVTGLPWQTGFSEATIETLTGVFVLTDMIIGLDITGFGVAQKRLEVILQVI